MNLCRINIRLHYTIFRVQDKICPMIPDIQSKTHIKDDCRVASGLAQIFFASLQAQVYKISTKRENLWCERTERIRSLLRTDT